MANERAHVGVGTANGALVFRENREGSHWDLVAHGLYGRKVACMVGREDGTIFAGAADGTVYSTTDWENWTPLYEGLKYTSVYSLALDPDNSDILYAGTAPAAVFKSTDQGRTWSHLENHRQVEGSDNWSFGQPPYTPRVNSLLRHPTRPDCLFTSVQDGGVVASFDGGATWEARQSGLPRQVTGLALHTGAPDRLYATTIIGFFRSDDLGKTWKNQVSGLPWINTSCVAVAPGSPDHLIAGVTKPDSGTGTLFRSENGGLSWTLASASLPLIGNSSITSVCAGATRFYAGSSGGHLYSSSNGTTWVPLRPPLPSIYCVAPILGLPRNQEPTP